MYIVVYNAEFSTTGTTITTTTITTSTTTPTNCSLSYYIIYFK